MTKTVFKYDLKPKIIYEGCSAAFVELPVNCRILHVGEQSGQLRLWALVEQIERRDVRRKFLIVPTGGIVHENATFIGTVQMASGLVWHVFEEH